MSEQKWNTSRKWNTLDIAVGGPHHVGSDAKNIPDDFFRPAELGDDGLIWQGCERRVAPSVNSDLMLTHVLGL